MKAIPARVIAVSALLTWIHCQSAPEANGQDIWRFAFGTPDSVTRTGFAKVTVRDAYTLEKGYGFLSTQGLEAFDRGGSEVPPVSLMFCRCVLCACPGRTRCGSRNPPRRLWLGSRGGPVQDRRNWCGRQCIRISPPRGPEGRCCGQQFSFWRGVGQVSDLPVDGVSDSARGQRPLQPADQEVCPTLMP
jgi:hypothetical protein